MYLHFLVETFHNGRNCESMKYLMENNAGAYCAAKFGLTGFTQSLAAEGKTHGIRACVLYPGGMATHWGTWSQAMRAASGTEASPVTKALPPAEVASLIVWIATAPAELVLSEAIVSPLEEEGWP